MSFNQNLTRSDLEINMNNLYQICLKYYSSLKEKNHEKINLITEIMDDLIELKKSDIKDDKLLENKFLNIHGKAYDNINTIYDYNKEQNIDNDVKFDKDTKVKIEGKDIIGAINEFKNKDEGIYLDSSS